MRSNTIRLSISTVELDIFNFQNKVKYIEDFYKIVNHLYFQIIIEYIYIISSMIYNSCHCNNGTRISKKEDKCNKPK